jgi:HEAT repeat protein
MARAATNNTSLMCRHFLVLALCGAAVAPGLAIDPDDSVDDLIAVLENESSDEIERIIAAGKLGNMGPSAAKAIPALVEMWEAEDTGLRFTAIDAVASIGIADDHRQLVSEALRRRLRDSAKNVKCAALMALWELNIVDPSFVSLLRDCLRSPDALVREQSALLLRDIGRGARSATRELITAMIEGRLRVGTACCALAEIGPQAAYYLLELTRDERPIVAKRIAESLCCVVGFTVPMTPRLLAGGDPLLDPEPVVRRAGVVHLALTSPQAKGTVTNLVKALDDNDREVRIYACLAIGHVGERAHSAIPALQSRLSDEDPDMRWAAAAALGGIGPEAQQVLKDLRPLQKDPADFVRLAADRAVGLISGEDVKSEFEGVTPGEAPPDFPDLRRPPSPPPPLPRFAPKPREGTPGET